MTIALLKLLDIALRALFFLIPLYLLDPRAAGQFGLLNTLVALSTFLVGFEHYRVMQRQLAKTDETETHALIASVIPFFCANYIVVAPILAVLIVFWLELPLYDAVLGLVIVIGEHLSNETYRLAVVSEKHRSYFSIALSKNFAGLMILLGVIGIQGSGLSLVTILEIWAGASAFGLIIVCGFYLRGKPPSLTGFRWTPVGLTEQYHAALTHFIIGLVALCSVQIDRIVIGGVSDLETAGIYFKNLFIAASVYQVVTVTIHNRFISGLYQAATHARNLQAIAVIRRESFRATMVYLTVIAAVLVAAAWTEILELIGRGTLKVEYLIGLLLAFVLRTIADHYCAFLNAYLEERSILVAHFSAACITAVLSMVLTSAAGISGTVTSVIIGSATLLVLSYWFHSRIRVNTERTG